MTAEEATVIDMRSDTVTKPTMEMRRAMMLADVGDDVYREDPTVLKLEEYAANLLGKEAALFVPSGTMANLTSIMAHCWERGSEVLVSEASHIYLYEQGGAAQIAGVQLISLRSHSDGTFDLQELERKINTKQESHKCITRLICLENTNNRCGGAVLPNVFVEQVCKIAKMHGIAVHMDGARIANAAVSLKQSIASLVKDCDSVSMCLSKGLGAPAGSLVSGSKEFIARVLRCRKVLGGGMRQVGVLAAAGQVALTSFEDKLLVDHLHAHKLAEAVNKLNSSLVFVNENQVMSNMVLIHFKTKNLTAEQFVTKMQEISDEEKKELGQAIIVKTFLWSSDQVRIVLHFDVTAEYLDLAVKKIEYVIKKASPSGVRNT